MFLQQGPITMSVIVIVVVMQVLLFRSRWGLRTRAVGEHPKAAETVGIDVIALRYRNVVLSGPARRSRRRLAHAWSTATRSRTSMTAGRGFIGLAAMIVGRWTPLGAFGAALLFASSQALGRVHLVRATERAAGRHPDVRCPAQFYDALPYLVTIIVLAGRHRPEHRHRPRTASRTSAKSVT